MNRHRNPSVYLQHISKNIALIEEATRGLTREAFMSQPVIQNAIMRCLEIIGEASKNIEDEFKLLHPDVRWREMAGTRDILIHHYFDVDLEETWNIVKNDLPILKKQIQKILKEMPESS